MSAPRRRQGAGAIPRPGLGDLAFAMAFTAYASVCAVLLLAGATDLLDDVLGPPRTLVVGLGAPQDAVQLALDYGASAVSVVLGLGLLHLRPHDRVARLLAVGMVGTAVAFNLHSHDTFVAYVDGWVNVGHFILHAIAALAYLHALLLFPDGRLPSGWPRRLLVVAYGLAAVELACIAASGLRLTGAGPVSVLALVAAMPFASDTVTTVTDIYAADASFFVVYFGVVVPLVGLAAQVQRARATVDAEAREQARFLGWTLAAAAAVGATFAVYAVAAGVVGATGVRVESIQQLNQWVFRLYPLVFLIVPLGFAAALLRFHLWDIDRIVNRAVTYTVLTGGLGALFVVAVAGVGLLVDQVGGHRLEAVGVGLVMLGVGALFQPARRRVQDLLDRRFARSRYDAVRAADAFSASARSQVDLEQLTDELLDVVEHTLEPEHGGVWMRT